MLQNPRSSRFLAGSLVVALLLATVAAAANEVSDGNRCLRLARDGVVLSPVERGGELWYRTGQPTRRSIPDSMRSSRRTDRRVTKRRQIILTWQGHGPAWLDHAVARNPAATLQKYLQTWARDARKLQPETLNRPRLVVCQAAPTVNQAVNQDRKVAAPVQPLFKPKVALSSEHRAMCRVGVGDTMPEIQLPNPTGKACTLDELFGEKLTVVVFWNIDHSYAVDEFQHLERDVVAPFGSALVSVVAIHVGKPSDKYKALCREYGSKVTCLLDADRQAFAKVATAKLPRTYVLDARGKILWFDLEYSRTTRFELHNALRYYLRKQPRAKKE